MPGVSREGGGLSQLLAAGVSQYATVGHSPARRVLVNGEKNRQTEGKRNLLVPVLDW